METNIFLLETTSDSINLLKVPYSEAKLSDLRKEHNRDYSFFRGGEYIYISPDTEETLNIGEIRETILSETHPLIFGSALRHLLFRGFVGMFGIIPHSFYPLRFVSTKHDVARDNLPHQLRDRIGFKRQIEVQIRRILIGDKIRFGAVFNFEYKWSNNISVAEMFKDGFNLQNLAVTHSVPIPTAAAVLAPEEHLIGTISRIEKVEGETIANVETNDGIVQYRAAELFLERSPSNVKTYLSWKLDDRTFNRVLNATSAETFSTINLKNLNKEIGDLAKAFGKARFANHSGFGFTISEKPLSFRNSFNIYNPSYIFDDDDFQKHNNPYLGLQSFGPSDKAFFSPKDLNILVICNSEKRGTFSEFISSLERGLPNIPDRSGRPKTNYFSVGFGAKYKLNRINFTLVEISDYSTSSYVEAIDNYLESGTKPDLLVIEIVSQFRELRTTENPYYLVKAHALGLGIPVQAIYADTIEEKRQDYAFFNLITLQMYAKLGGVPWVLPKRGSFDKEIVVGVGSSVQRSNRFAGNQSKKVVGITTFFTGEGRYLFGNRCKEVDYDGYFDELLNSLETSIKTLSSDYNWQSGVTVLIVFHIFKTLKNVEVQVIEELVKKFADYSIKFAFLTISDRHPFLLFDTAQPGSYGKGELLPAKGSNLKLSSYECLVQTRSVADIKSVKHGSPKPLLISLVPAENSDINYKDLGNLSQQILNFSNLSFRGFQTAKSPVTIEYADLIAKWLSNLKKISGWKPQVANTELKRKKWFL